MVRRPALLTLAVVGVLTLGACSDEGQDTAACGVEPGAPADQDLICGNAGVNAQVDPDVTIADVELAFPADGAGYAVGDDADLYLAVTNTGPEDATLVEVRAPEAGSVVGDLPIEVPANDNVYIGAEGEPTLSLQDLQTSLRSSQSTEVTFVFQDAGEVTVQVPVAASPQTNSDEDFAPVDEETGSEG